MLRFLALSNQPLESFSSDAKLALKYVYRFLALLARNHSEAKKEMVGWISRVKTHAREDCCEDNLFPVDKLQLKSNLHDPLFLLHLQMRDDCEAIELLVELFTDNKALLFSEPEMETVTAEIAEMINCVTIRSYYKAHLLDFLRSLAYYKDKHIPVNKSRILAKLQDSEKDNIYYRFDLPMFNGLNDRRIEQLVV